MKQGSFKAVRFLVCLILMAGMAVISAFADDISVDYLAVVLESFNGSNTSHEWTIGSKTYTYDFTWKLDASRFASNIDGEQFPKMNYVPSWPQALFGPNRAGKDLQSIGIWGKFDRRGYNWIDLYPVSSDDEPFEIPIPGRISFLDMWIWGSNMNFYIEAYIRDHQGIIHVINMGNLAYAGWRNLRVRVPGNLIQSKRVLPRHAGVTFVKFRIWSTPVERVENFYIYLNQFKILTDVFETLFDGDDLADPDHIQEIWANQ
ncbi:MAG: flagellar filament outer layer protein FlaA [Treponema sp.]|jgi:hypothetical protein|nr:flagellar filament outer layer protein FlaA [Treponema sp.]